MLKGNAGHLSMSVPYVCQTFGMVLFGNSVPGFSNRLHKGAPTMNLITDLLKLSDIKWFWKMTGVQDCFEFKRSDIQRIWLYLQWSRTTWTRWQIFRTDLPWFSELIDFSTVIILLDLIEIKWKKLFIIIGLLLSLSSISYIIHDKDYNFRNWILWCSVKFLHFIAAMTKLTQPVFVSREDPSSRQKTVREIQRRAATGGKWPQILLFPEGTTTNGSCLIYFKLGETPWWY